DNLGHSINLIWRTPSWWTRTSNMSIKNLPWLRRFAAARLISLSAALGVLGGVTALAALRDAGHVVSQKDRAFQPRQLSLHQGESITFLNNDGDLLHHAYL